MPIEWIAGLLDTDRWMPRWSCGQWAPWEGWLYITSDLLIAAAYFAIPAIIAAYVWKRWRELPFVKIFLLFFLFIFLCGTTHLIDAIIFWEPVYQLSAFVRFATALVSWATVVALIYIMPQALKLKTALQFEEELQHRAKVEKELAEKLEELEMAQRIAGLAGWKYVDDLTPLETSSGFWGIFGLEPGRLYKPEEIKKGVHPDDIDRVNEAQRIAKETGNPYDVQYRYTRPDGRNVHIHTRGIVKKDGNGRFLGMQGFSQDVTQLKATESALEKRAQELESINKELELFAYAASHDLQEPLRKLRAFGDRLSQRYSDKLDEQGQDYLRRMDNAADRMQILIEDLLKYSQLARNKDEIKPVALNALIDEVLSDLEETINQKGIKVEVEALPTIQGLPSQLRQLFQNILSNAFKFTREGVVAEVHIGYRTAKGRELPWKNALSDMAKYHVIEVRDNGIGFDQQFEEKIFAMFQRLHGRSEYAGTGIGLALCKKIVENHQGIIRAIGKENEGSTFYVILPVKND